MPKTETEYLTSKGWVNIGGDNPWRWQQPGTRAFYTLSGAIENQQALDRENQRLLLARRNQKGIKGS